MTLSLSPSPASMLIKECLSYFQPHAITLLKTGQSIDVTHRQLKIETKVFCNRFKSLKFLLCAMLQIAKFFYDL